MADDAREWWLAYVDESGIDDRRAFFADSFSSSPSAMKKLIARFWFASIIAFLLAVQLVWVLFVTLGVNHITTRLLFPVLFVAGIVIHFRTR